MKAKRKQFTNGRTARLDARRTKNEQKPNRMTHRIHEVLEQIEGRRVGDKKAVTKDLSTKSVKVGDSTAGFCKGLEWQWCQGARDRYTVEDLDMAKAYAEQS